MLPTLSRKNSRIQQPSDLLERGETCLENLSDRNINQNTMEDQTETMELVGIFDQFK